MLALGLAEEELPATAALSHSASKAALDQLFAELVDPGNKGVVGYEDFAWLHTRLMFYNGRPTSITDRLQSLGGTYPQQVFRKFDLNQDTLLDKAEWNEYASSLVSVLGRAYLKDACKGLLREQQEQESKKVAGALAWRYDDQASRQMLEKVSCAQHLGREHEDVIEGLLRKFADPNQVALALERYVWQSLSCPLRLKEHTDGISSLAFAEDGERLLSASRDGTLRLWELTGDVEKIRELGESSKVLRGHRGPVSCVAMSRDGKHAVSSSWDTTLKYWSLDTGRCLRTFKGHEGHVNCVCFSAADDMEFLSVSSDRTARCWATTGSELGRLKDPDCACCHDDWITAVAHVPGDFTTKKAVTCGWDRQIRVWDSGARTILSVLPCMHTAAVHAVEISPDGSLLASGGRDGTVLLWDVQETKLLLALEVGHCVNALVYNPMQYWLAVATDEGVEVWELEQKSRMALLTPGPAAAGSIATTLRWTPQGKSLLVGYSTGVVEVYKQRVLRLLMLGEIGGDNTGVENEETALHSQQLIDKAAELTAKDARDLLLKGASVNYRNDRGWSPLTAAVFWNNHEYVECLVKLPHKSTRTALQADLPDSRGRTALHVAARKGLTELVPLILGSRANPDARDSDGWTALHHAVFNGHSETARAPLLEPSVTVLGISTEGPFLSLLQVIRVKVDFHLLFARLTSSMSLDKSAQAMARPRREGGVRGFSAKPRVDPSPTVDLGDLTQGCPLLDEVPCQRLLEGFDLNQARELYQSLTEDQKEQLATQGLDPRGCFEANLQTGAKEGRVPMTRSRREGGVRGFSAKPREPPPPPPPVEDLGDLTQGCPLLDEVPCQRLVEGIDLNQARQLYESLTEDQKEQLASQGLDPRGCFEANLETGADKGPAQLAQQRRFSWYSGGK
ncbi:RACK1 [Symbiodinium natans]|uniref:RACK1 protein n=1 Tax=Symbiodinium natans TaxID=878477 RepID=A0A812TK41_9DINO|nr:RACK1 [Symbiodinium natans]